MNPLEGGVPAAIARNDIQRATRLPGRAICQNWSGYRI